MRISHTLCLILILPFASHASAQQRVPVPQVPDSSVACLVAPSLIQALRGQIAGALLDSTPKRWPIEVPESTSLVWQKLASGLSTLLHTRPATPQDTARHLQIRPIYTIGDTLIASFNYSVTFPCTKAGELSTETVSYSFAIGLAGELWDSPRQRPSFQGHGRCLPENYPA